MTTPEKEDTLQSPASNFDVTRLVLGTLVVLLIGANVVSFYALRGGAAATQAGPAARAAADPLKDIRVINGHDHLRMERDLPKYFDAAERQGIDATLFVASSDFTIKGDKFSPAEGNEANTREILRVAKAYPGKIIPFATFHPGDANKLELLQEYLAEGAKGIKLYTGHGNFYDRPLLNDDMRPLYAFCEEQGVPICWHVNLNKYSEELTQVLLQFPRLKVILPHFGVSFYNPGGAVMQTLAKILDNYPSVYVDSSFGTRDILVSGLEEVSAATAVFRDFYERYQDRIIFGTDMVVTGNREKTTDWISSVLRACRDMHEKEDYYFWMAADGSPYSLPNKSNPYGHLRGLNLPEEILEKVYHQNLERLLGP